MLELSAYRESVLHQHKTGQQTHRKGKQAPYWQKKEKEREVENKEQAEDPKTAVH